MGRDVTVPHPSSSGPIGVSLVGAKRWQVYKGSVSLVGKITEVSGGLRIQVREIFRSPVENLAEERER